MSKNPLPGIIPWNQVVAKNGMGVSDTDWSVHGQEYDRREMLEREGARFNCHGVLTGANLAGFVGLPSLLRQSRGDIDVIRECDSGQEISP